MPYARPRTNCSTSIPPAAAPATTRVGGKPGSFHIYDRQAGVYGCGAVDICIASGAECWQIVRLAQSLGWSVGVAATFLHLDRRTDYPESGFPDPLLFTY